MKDIDGLKNYSPIEEKINIISHATGFIIGIVALVLLVTRANRHGNIWHIVSFSIFGAASIYVLIAGTYTPFSLVTLKGALGWVIFGISWGLALAGIILKLFFTGRYDLFSTIMYVLMGWVIVFVIKPLIDNLPSEGLLWLFAGGISYTMGAILYGIKKIKFNHAIFHILVLIGSFCHFITVFFYVLPSE
jgi:hemolysin III